ncbi:TetR/AcrR family transcriptional regulator [Pauljensenia hongkongensis]|uniref:Transcriptional regulator n=1 Tax=Pauljensenia hongkongensis TaxID=178339 RepID=A0A1D8B2Z8_9ACTO|nr:TetR/AcrR family transcriptional regulator [Pauljensenia hongkongensis]AOS47496.1 transcriptional regulator [Pauljensenia hongkongensis]EFW09680.1 regulatory protein [Actinomyces sp. oral taxon 178 str. F0338]
MRRTAEDAAKTRVALLEAALIAFEEKGWRGATFEHIAERAGVTRGALHHHFRDKRTLLAEALEWGWSDYGQRLFDTVSPATGDTGSADGTVALDERAHRAVEELLARFVRLITGDRAFRALASTTVLVAPQAFEHYDKGDALDDWRERIEGIVASRRGATNVAPRDIAGLVLVLLQGFTVAAVTRPDDLPQPDRLDATMAALVKGLLET